MNAVVQRAASGVATDLVPQRDAVLAALPATSDARAEMPARGAEADRELALELEAIVEASIDVLADEILDEVMAARCDDGVEEGAS